MVSSGLTNGWVTNTLGSGFGSHHVGISLARDGSLSSCQPTDIGYIYSSIYPPLGPPIPRSRPNIRVRWSDKKQTSSISRQLESTFSKKLEKKVNG